MPVFDVKNYVGVQERITQFWDEYPDGRIWTDMKSLPDEWEQVVFFAAVYKHKDDPNPAATGWDAATKGSGGANNTAWHANCETSAIGRALANMGYAKTSDERASREEMERVVHQPSRGNAPVARQDAPQRQEAPRQASGATRTGNHEQAATPRQIQFISALAREIGMSEEELRAESSRRFSRDVGALNRRDASILIEELTKRRPIAAIPAPQRNNIPSGPPEPVEPDDVEHDNIDTQAMIADFDRRHPADAAKFRQ
jgi:hypothetical protein